MPTRPATPSAPLPPDARSPWVRLRSASQHPFLYQRMLDEVDPGAKPGDIVTIYDRAGRLFGSGLYNPRSQIALRVLTNQQEPIDEAWWRGRLAEALELRTQLNLTVDTDAYRLVHAEGDRLSGLVVERYADCLVFEMFSLGMWQRFETISKILKELLGPAASLENKKASEWRTVLRVDDRAAAHEGIRVKSDSKAAADAESHKRVIIREHGIRYRVDVEAGHKTGFFCDQRDNRKAFANLCRDASVLDLCCYTGGFGLSAKLLGKAETVTSVDLDEAAIAVARENMNLNQTRIDLVHADIFAYMRQMNTQKRRYDVVVLDPPKLALSREEYEEALFKYHDMNTLAMTLVRPGGILLTCSCSGLVSRNDFIETVHRAGRRAMRSLQMFNQSGAAADHPIHLDCPESSYLKALWFRVL